MNRREAMALAVRRVGPSPRANRALATAQAAVGVNAWVVTPAALRADLVQTNSDLESLGRDIHAHLPSLDASFIRAWSEFFTVWAAFYQSAEPSTWERLWSSTNDRLEDFKRQGRAWRDRFVALGGRPTAPARTESPELFGGGTGEALKAIAIIGALVLGAVILVKVT